MSLETVKQSDQCTIIKINGRFDFSCHSAFREAYSGSTPGTEFIVDMAEASYMDSAALGMLLLLREHTQQQGGKVTITNCRGQTYDVLQIANFHRLFKIVQ
ncbi:MAG TPA: STAS domain-containing protein [Polyangiales bacterium]|jgi:anti-anti-sigma factor|nr:STAS domain-containing protein [Polyangiales bacterium]